MLDFAFGRGRLLAVLLIAVIVALLLLVVAVSGGAATVPQESRAIERPSRPVDGTEPHGRAA